MKRPLPCLLCILMLVGCSNKTKVTSSAYFNAEANSHLKADIVPDGPLDQLVQIEGVATSAFLVRMRYSLEMSKVGVTTSETTTKGNGDEIELQVTNGKLSFANPQSQEQFLWRRESDKELAIYWPLELRNGERSWVKFRIRMKAGRG